MDKLRRIFAAAGAVVLLGMYLLTFISAILATPATHALFLGSLSATIIIPIFLYAYTLIYKMVYKKKDEYKEEADKDKKL
ncbi:MAG: hypothetical protein HFH66_06910 [Lachnospiraceae bacterium]|nr:hypothetical protein [Lachnospiraceae bacterium]